MSKELKARQLRRALQLSVENIKEESVMMEVADLYPSWEELLAAKKQYPAGKIFRWGADKNGETQLWRFLSEYTPQEIYTPDQDSSHYQKVGVTDSGVPIWTQPLSAEDAYEKGDVVGYQGNLWKSVFDGKNVWEPGVFGWEEEPETH